MASIASNRLACRAPAGMTHQTLCCDGAIEIRRDHRFVAGRDVPGMLAIGGDGRLKETIADGDGEALRVASGSDREGDGVSSLQSGTLGGVLPASYGECGSRGGMCELCRACAAGLVRQGKPHGRFAEGLCLPGMTS